MDPKDNPLLQPEDFMAGYQESIEQMKNRPELVAFDRMCYELFVGNELGKKFIEHITDRFLIPPMADRSAANFKTDAIWAEGFKDFARMLRSSAKSHEQRILAGEKK